MCYQLLAARSLRDESKKVYDALQTGDIEKSRYAVSMIVGRDTRNLTEEGVTKAALVYVSKRYADKHLPDSDHCVNTRHAAQ